MGEPEKATQSGLIFFEANEVSNYESPIDSVVKSWLEHFSDEQERGKKVFPRLFSEQFAEESGLDSVSVELMRTVVGELLATEKIEDKQKLVDALKEFFEIAAEESEEKFRKAAEKITPALSSEEIEDGLDRMEEEGRFDHDAAYELQRFGLAKLYENPSDTVMWALCSAYVNIEENVMKSLGLDSTRETEKLTPADFMRIYATLKGAQLIKTIDYPQCSKQKGGPRNLEERDDFIATIRDAVATAGGLNAWNRMKRDDQIIAVADSSKKYRRGISLSAAKVWIARARDAGMFDADGAKTQS